ncbi:Aste57867_8792 [Aphanomyces stellatus]|uniref:Aste57867_8792 protein n=1 Tax=Aphanomyces stellatus TaxID=120398 RepID=A0A485KL54_9STRA|nr:hypothetical protein As57867_008757 [Aphanomyces stellatus]VFT85678.1 Aste57867_8792 [Aphanomyces stellatus]
MVKYIVASPQSTPIRSRCMPHLSLGHALGGVAATLVHALSGVDQSASVDARVSVAAPSLTADWSRRRAKPHGFEGEVVALRGATPSAPMATLHFGTADSHWAPVRNSFRIGDIAIRCDSGFAASATEFASKTQCLRRGHSPPMDLELADDWYSSMLAAERKHFHYAPQPHYLKIRLILVDWMGDVGDELQLPKEIVHSAVAYLDRLLNVPTALPPQSHLQLVCLVCLFVAAKYAAVECDVPSMDEMVAYGHGQYTVDDIKACEVATLQALGWSLSALTPLHVAQFYLATSFPLYADDDLYGCALDDPTPYKSVFAKHVEFVADMVLQEHAFQQWLPSVLATAAICVVRRILHIAPVWREEIEMLSGYVVADVEDCFHAMWSHYAHHFSAPPKDEPSPCYVGAV